jgi:hypothetical protein
LLLVVLATGLSGCLGVDGPRAQALLQQAEQAQANVSSERFVMRFDIDADGHSASMAMQGGAYMKGPQAGDFYLTGTGSGAPELASLNFTVVRHGGTAAFRMNGSTHSISLPQEQQQFGSPTDYLDLARHVKSVSVDATTYNGRPADRIVGKLDTQGLLGSAGGLATQALGAAGVHVGDIRAVLFVSRDTHLVEVMFADITMSARGHKVHMHLSIATSDVNKPVSIPQL